MSPHPGCSRHRLFYNTVGSPGQLRRRIVRRPRGQASATAAVRTNLSLSHKSSLLSYFEILSRYGTLDKPNGFISTAGITV